MVTIGTAIDLFAGAGRATEGLARAGFSVRAAVESDGSAAESYRVNHPLVRLVKDDIREVDAPHLRAELGLERGELTLLKACPPCQGYSSIGKGDATDPRNDLVAEVWRFTRVFQPRMVMDRNSRTFDSGVIPERWPRAANPHSRCLAGVKE